MLILFGAGTTGRVIARDLKTKGVEAVFADNDPGKWDAVMEGFYVYSAQTAMREFPDATWVCSVVRPERAEILAQIAAMGVKTAAMWDYVPKRYNLPPKQARGTIESGLIADNVSLAFWMDQLYFRSNPSTYKQIPQSNIDHIYFEDFIVKRDDEHYVDCGAADGDTVRDFIKWSENYRAITAIEPDESNYEKLYDAYPKGIRHLWSAVSDFTGEVGFTSTRDYSSHIGGTGKVPAMRLDTLPSIGPVPTFIKMDIEGSELEALWGARRILKDHKPVLAICAYHEAEHLWEIPLLIHALQPEYELFLRRYAESTFELVWYAVPKERVK